MKKLPLSLVITCLVFLNIFLPIYALDNQEEIQRQKQVATLIPIITMLLESDPALAKPTITTSHTYAIEEDLSIDVRNLPANNGDWIGIYPKNSNNDWGNQLRWTFTNGTHSQNDPGVEEGNFIFAGLAAGEYEARLFFNNTFVLEAKASFSVVDEISVVFGARVVEPTPLAQGTLFASPDGAGAQCSEATPCNIVTAFTRLAAGEVLFLRGGTYTILTSLNVTASGTEANPIIIESYPGENAILDGQNETPADIIGDLYPTGPGLWVHTGNNYVSIRKLEIKNMSNTGIKLDSLHNTIEGCVTHSNHYNGIHITDGEKQYNAPYVNGYNIIRDNIVYNNSDVGLLAGEILGSPYNNGNNSDGISVSSSRNNRIVHNTVYANSDDGIDTWRSNYSYVAYNLSFDNGKGDGNGNGFKTGSTTDDVTGLGATVEHNLSYNNKSRGFNSNGGLSQTYRFNTAYNNASVGFKTTDDTVVTFNISSNLNVGIHTVTRVLHSNNSWQEDRPVPFISVDPVSNDFLKPVAGSIFENMGAHAE